MGNKGRGGGGDSIFHKFTSLVDVNVVYVMIIFRTSGGIYKKISDCCHDIRTFSSFFGRIFFFIIFSVFIFRHLLFFNLAYLFSFYLKSFWCFLSQKKKLEQIKILY